MSSIPAPPVLKLDSEDSTYMASFLAFLASRLNLVFPFRDFKLNLYTHSAEVIMEFGRLVGRDARRYSVNNFVHSANDDHKLALLLAASPNIVELYLETDALLNSEDIRRLPTFKHLRVSVGYLPGFRIFMLFNFSVKRNLNS